MAASAIVVINEESNKDVVTGKITLQDPATALNVSIGFSPSKVLLNHVTDVSDYEWNKNMTAGTANLRVTAGDKTLVGSGCISAYAGDDTHSPGFTIGTDATLNAAASVLYFTAFR